MSIAQLPNDVELIGYKMIRPFHYDAVYKSKVADFIGTEHDFVRTGSGYYYLQLDKHTRREVQA